MITGDNRTLFQILKILDSNDILNDHLFPADEHVHELSVPSYVRSGCEASLPVSYGYTDFLRHQGSLKAGRSLHQCQNGSSL